MVLSEDREDLEFHVKAFSSIVVIIPTVTHFIKSETQ